MTDRDHFAAAALAGLLPVMRDEDGLWPNPESLCAAAFDWADDMLCERERVGNCPPKKVSALKAEELEALERATWVLPRKEADIVLALIGRLG